MLGQVSIAERILNAKSSSQDEIEQIEALQLLLDDPSFAMDQDTIGLIQYAIAFRYWILGVDSLIIKHSLDGLESFDAGNYEGYERAFLYSFLGESYGHLSEVEKSIRAYQKITEITDHDARELEVIGLVYNELAKAFISYEDYNFARSITDQFLASNFKDIIPQLELTGILLSGSIAYSSFDDEDLQNKATELLHQAQSLYEQGDSDHDIGISLRMQSAFLALKDNRQDEAGQIYEDLLSELSKEEQSELTNETITDLASNASYVYQEMESFEEALIMARRAQQTFILYGSEDFVKSEYIIYDNLANAFLGLGQLDSAMYYIDLGITLFPKNKIDKRNRGFVLNLLYDKSRILFAKGTFNPEFYEEAISNLEKLDGLFDMHVQDQLSEYSVINLKKIGLKYYHKAIEIATKLDDQEAFWYFSEKTKGLLLLRAHATHRQYDQINATERYLDDLKKEKFELEHELTLVNSDHDKSTVNLDKIMATGQKIISQTIALQGPPKGFPDPVDLKSMQDQIKRNQHILQYQFTADSLWLQVISNTGYGIHNLGRASDIKGEIIALLTLLRDPETSILELNSIVGSLYQQLIEPLRIEKGDILIIPDQILHFLPFDILKARQEDKYLIESHSISYLPSGAFMNLKSDQKNIEGISLYAPIYSGATASLKSLPYAQEEVEGIHSILIGSTVFKEYVDKGQFINRMDESSIFHFCGHAIAKDDAELNYLALNSSNSWEGRLGLNEIHSLSTRANLVTLSACDTGTGEVINGEGVSSLSRAFLYAGAQSVVSTLWQVDDHSTSKILVNFYAKLKEGQSKARALQEAKLEYLQSAESYERHPYYWAGIIGTGIMTEPIYQPINWWKLLFFFLILAGLVAFLTWRYSRKPFPKLVFLTDWSDLVGEEKPRSKRGK